MTAAATLCILLSNTCALTNRLLLLTMSAPGGSGHAAAEERFGFRPEAAVSRVELSQRSEPLTRCSPIRFLPPNFPDQDSRWNGPRHIHRRSSAIEARPVSPSARPR